MLYTNPTCTVNTSKTPKSQLIKNREQNPQSTDTLHTYSKQSSTLYSHKKTHLLFSTPNRVDQYTYTSITEFIQKLHSQPIFHKSPHNTETPSFKTPPSEYTHTVETGNIGNHQTGKNTTEIPINNQQRDIHKITQQIS